MSNEIIKSIVRIINKDGITAGAGFLAHKDGYIVTASHVILSYEQQNQGTVVPSEVDIEFIGHTHEARNENVKTFTSTLLLEHWRPFNSGDIAILHFREKIPVGVKVLSLGSSLEERTSSDQLRFYGFPNDDVGEIGKGSLLGRIIDESYGFDVLQVDSKLVSKGYSGSPALNIMTGNVVGLVSWIRDKDRTFLIPSESINAVFPKLKLQPAFPPLLYSTLNSGKAVRPFYQKGKQGKVENLYEDLKFKTLKFLDNIPEWRNNQAKVIHLSTLSIYQIFDGIDTYMQPIDAWELILSRLEYKMTNKIIEILSSAPTDHHFYPDADRQKIELIKRWKEVSVFPYKYIFYDYLNEILTESEYLHLDQVYIELIGEKEFGKDAREKLRTLNPVAVEQNHGFQTVEGTGDWEDTDISPKNYWRKKKASTKKKETTKKDNSPRIDYILNIASYEDRFIMVGAPGSGKTFTMKKVVSQNAREILVDNKTDVKIPILVIANQFNNHKTFKDLILDAFSEWNNPDLDKSQFVILIDGFNEVNPAFQLSAKSELVKLLEDKEEFSLILSSRKYGFQNIYELPLFELKELQPYQVREYIGAYLPDYQELIWNEINDPQNERFNSLAFNPLTLFMIIFIYKKDKVFPTSRGDLFRRFIYGILEWEKDLFKTKLSPSGKEGLLSELGLYMRKKDFNPPIWEVESLFKKEIKNLETVHQLIDDLCNSYILKIDVNDVQKHPNKLLTFDQATEEGTISFMHESYLEYFCSLQLKKVFLSHNTLDIDFWKTEWFETVLMASDLFDEEKNISKYLICLYYGGTPRSIGFSPKRIMGRIDDTASTTLYANIDYNTIFYSHLNIACKTANNVRKNHPKAFEAIEDLLIRDLKIWTKYFTLDLEKNPSLEPNPDVFELILSSVSSLSSEKVFDIIFKTDAWEMIWLIPQGRQRPGVTGNLAHRVNVFIEHLSDFELFYSYLEESDFSYRLVARSMNMINLILETKMPVKVQKRLYEDLVERKIKDSEKLQQLLGRIGRQDPEYYIGKFDYELHSVDSFVKFLLDLSYNDKAQEKLLDMLFSNETKEETQYTILISLMQNFYGEEQILKFLDENFEHLASEESFRSILYRFLSAYPYSRISDKLKQLYQTRALDNLQVLLKTMSLDGSSSLKLLKKQEEFKLAKIESRNRARTKKLFFVRFAYLPEKLMLKGGILNFSQRKDLSIKFIGILPTKKNKKHHLVLAEYPSSEFQKIPTSGNVLINGSVSRNIRGKGVIRLNGKHHKTLIIKKVADFDLIPFDECFFEFADSHAYYYTKFLIQKDNILLYFKDEYLIQTALSASQSKIFFANHWYEILDSGVEDVLENTFELVALDFETNEELESTDWFVSTPQNTHPDLITKHKDKLLKLFETPENNSLRELFKHLGVSYLFHNQMKDIHYGITLKVLVSKKKIIYYSHLQNRIMAAYLPEHKLMDIRVNQIIVIEKNNLITQVSVLDEPEKAGFITSFIINIFTHDENEQYLFIFNKENKDFFLHFSRLNFFPSLYDQVFFYPCLNYTKQYRNFPIARKVEKIGSGNENLKIDAFQDYLGLVNKYNNALKLRDKPKIKASYLLGLINCYYELRQYRNCIKSCDKLFSLGFDRYDAQVTAGNCFFHLKDYQEAIIRYTKVYYIFKSDHQFLNNYATCFLRTGKFDRAIGLYNDYFSKAPLNKENLPLQKRYLFILLENKSFNRAELFLARIPEELHSDLGFVYRTLGTVKGKNPDTLVKAYSYFEKALKYQPDTLTFLTYAVFLYRVSNFKLADDYLYKINEGDREFAEVEFSRQTGQISRLLLDKDTRQEKPDKYLDMYYRNIKTNPVRALKVLKSLKSYHQKHKKIDKAIFYFLRKNKLGGGMSTFFELDVYELALSCTKMTAAFAIEYAVFLQKKGIEKLDLALKSLNKHKEILPSNSKYYSELFASYADILKQKMLRLRDRGSELDFTEDQYNQAMEDYDTAIDNSICETQRIKLVVRKIIFLAHFKKEEHFAQIEDTLEEIEASNPYNKSLLVVRKILNSNHSSKNRRVQRKGRKK